MFLVRAHFALADQARLDGFLTPATSGPSNDRVLGEIQPQLFLDTGKRIAFWLGMFGNPSSAAQELYAALAKNADAVFPMQFRALDGLASGITRGELRGFYIIPDGQTVDIIR